MGQTPQADDQGRLILDLEKRIADLQRENERIKSLLAWEKFVISMRYV